MASFSFLHRRSTATLLLLLNPTKNTSLSSSFLRSNRILSPPPPATATSTGAISRSPFETLQSQALFFHRRSSTVPNRIAEPQSLSKIPPFAKPLYPNPSSATTRTLSTGPPEGGEAGHGKKDSDFPEFKHQEIVGPTVERDLSALANKTQQVLDGLRHSIYDFSSSLALLGVGLWVVYAVRPPDEVVV